MTSNLRREAVANAPGSLQAGQTGHSHLILALDVGGTRTKAGLVSSSTAELLASSIYPTAASSSEEFLAQVDQAAQDLLCQAGAGWADIGGVGIGLPGYVDGDSISQVWDSMAYMEGDAFRPALEQALRRPVAIDNDARAIALAEFRHGGHGQPERLLSLTLGTGIGFGLVLNAKLHEEKPLSHMAPHILIRPGTQPCYCGQDGCLESLVNTRRLQAEFQRLAGPGALEDPPDSREILSTAARQVELQQPGAELAAVQQMLSDLIAGLNVFIYTYAPQIFVMGGGLAQGLATFLPTIQGGLVAQPFRGFHSQVRISNLGEKAGLLGAAEVFLRSARTLG